jgi:hypothetical protein
MMYFKILHFKSDRLLEGSTRQGDIEGCYQGGQGSQRAVAPDKWKKRSIE